MSNEQVPPETAPQTKGVTVKVLSTVAPDLEIEGMAGRQLRMHLCTEPKVSENGVLIDPTHAAK